MKRILILISILISSVAVSQKRPITFDDLIGMKRVSGPQISPDGQWVAFVITSYDLAQNNSMSNIYLVGIDGGAVRQLTAAKGQNREPHWTPDGGSILFVSSREGGSQIWKIPVSGGEAVRLSSISTGASGLILSADGRLIAFTSDVFPDCDSDDCNEQRMKEREESKVKAKIFTSLPYRVWNYWKDGLRSHVFTMPSDGGEAVDVTPGDFDSPPIDLGGSQDFDLSPDGTELAFTRNTDPVVAVSTNNDLFLVPAGGGEARRMTVNPANDTQPIYSPDGKYIAYQKMDRAGFEADRRQLVIYERATQKHLNITETLDYSVGQVVWSPDSKALYFTANDKGNNSIFRIDRDGKDVKKIVETGYNRNLAITPDGKTLVFSRERMNAPAELYRVAVNGQSLKRLTSVTEEIVSTLEMNPAEAFWFEGAEGTRVHGWLVRPPGFQEGHKYPLVYLLHGGPQGQWGDQFHYRWNAEMFASRGYVVAMVNRRGSTGFGQKFTDEVSKDWGGRPYEDLMKGLDYIIATYPFVDGERIAAAGASYGGYMANWIAANTNRFTCIVSHDGVFNPVSMYGTTEELWFPEWEFGGPPYDNMELYNRWSPLRLVSKMNTPMLVIHGQRDYRLDVSEGFQLFTALQRRGVESKMLYFPDEGHWVLKPQNAALWWKTVLDWIDEHTMSKQK